MADTLTSTTANFDVEVDDPQDGYDDHGDTVTGISNEKLGMWVFLGSECLMFGGLISTYLLYKNRPGEIEGLSGTATKPSDLFDIPFTSASSFILLASSLTMVFAVGAAHRGDAPRTRRWLATTAALGSLFIGGQIYEFTAFYEEGLGYTSNVAASAFYTLTGFHGVHVTVGIIMLLVTILMSAKGRIPQSRGEAVEIVGLYWHFVDVVWILIFTVVYLIP